MSLARSLTSRMRARFEEHSAPVPNRAFSTKVTGTRPADKNIDRRLISLPVELLSTSNAQAYEAPDIKNLIEPKHAPHSPSHPPSQPLSPHIPTSLPQSPLPDQQLSPQLTTSSASSTRSWEDGLASPALTSASSVTSNECSREPSPASCDPNAMSSFFLEKDEEAKENKAMVTVMEVPESPEEEARESQELKEQPKEHQRTRSIEFMRSRAYSFEQQEQLKPAEPAPAVPQRSATHTKQTHLTLARARSQSRESGLREAAAAEAVAKPSHSPQSSTASQAPPLPPAARTSTDMFGSKPASDHPFGAELAKVSELAEEFGAREVQIVDEETQYLIDNGFRCFGATDYIHEIQPLFSRAFGEPALPVIAEWI